MNFKDQILQGIPKQLPAAKSPSAAINHAPKRKDILSAEEKRLAVRNALRYFPKEWHSVLAGEFMEELKEYGRIYICLLYTSPSPRDLSTSRMPSSA